MKDELDLSDVLKIIIKRKFFIIGFTLAAILLTAIFSFMMPKTYRSTAIIQLAEIPVKNNYMMRSVLLINAEEARNIILSSEILGPVMTELFEEYEKQESDDFGIDLDVVIMPEKIGRNEIPTDFLIIQAEAKDPIVSQKLLIKIIDEAFNHFNKELNKHKRLIIKEYNESIGLAEKDYNEKVEYIKDEISEREQNMRDIEENILNLEEQIDSLSLSEESIAKSTLLISIINNYRSQLLNEKNRKISLEQQITNKELDLNKFKTVKEIELSEKLIYLKDFKVISEPKIPRNPSSPNIKLNLVIGLVLGLMFSTVWVYLQAYLK